MTHDELAGIEEIIARAKLSNGMAPAYDLATIHADALVAEVRRLRGVVEAAKAYLDEWDSDGFEYVAHVALIDAVRAFVASEGSNA